MIAGPGNARVLVAADDLKDADLVQGILKDHFRQLRCAVNPDRLAADFADFKPEVLVLAFNTLEKAERHYLGLYRSGQLPQQDRYRTVVLCSKEELQAAFELCKKRVFDDYVQFWPYALDGPRLVMSIWNAGRDIQAAEPAIPPRTELLSHARHLGDLDQAVNAGLSQGDEKLAVAREALEHFEREIAHSAEEFSQRVLPDGASGVVRISDAGTLLKEVENLRNRQVAHARHASNTAVETVSSWAHALKEQIEPPLAATRSLAAQIRKLRPLVMVVDDDELMRELLGYAIDANQYDTVFAADGLEAVRELRRRLPDVILMDIRLPGLDGVSLTKRLKESPRLAAIPVIMVTGDSRRETLLNSVEAGAADFIVKPFTRESLTAKLEKALGR